METAKNSSVEQNNTIQKDWKEIHPDFNEELQKEWESKGFNYEQAKEWINTGLKPADADYAKWLRNIKKVDTNWLLNHGNNEQLKEQYAEYLYLKNVVNAQEWLDKEYPKEQRNKITQINANNKNLKGELIIQDFPNLEKVEVRNNKGITNI